MDSHIKKRTQSFIFAFVCSFLLHIFLFLFLMLTPTVTDFFTSYMIENFLELEKMSFSQKEKEVYQEKDFLAKKKISPKTEPISPKDEPKPSETQNSNQDLSATPSNEPSQQTQTHSFPPSFREEVPSQPQNPETPSTTTISQNKGSLPNTVFLPKKLVYEIFYGPFKLGETVIIIEKNRYTAIVYTTGFGNTFYPYYAKWETWTDEKGNPLKTIIYSKDREKERKKYIFFEKEKSVVLVKKGEENKPGETFNMTYPLYDELSSFIDSWMVDYLIHPKVEFPIYVKEERKFVKISVRKEIDCFYQDKEKICLELKIKLPETSELLSRNREVIVYLLKEEKYPLEIRGKLPLIGSLVGKLKEIVK